MSTNSPSTHTDLSPSMHTPTTVKPPQYGDTNKPKNTQEDTRMPAPNRTSEIAASEDLNSIREDLASLRSDLSSLVSNVASGGKHAAQMGAQTITSTARTAADHLKSAHSGACEAVKSHPTASILIAAGLGAIAARLVFPKVGR